MKIPINDIIIVYEKIVKEINIAQVSMVLFTALDVDALCTLKILSKFLKNENIQYKIYPAASYTELEERIQECKTYEKVRLFFFINCGGLIDLTTKWFSKQAIVFLFDVNKPIHHANIEAQNIKIIDDEFSELEKAPTSQEVQLYQNIDDDMMEEMEQREMEKDDDEDLEDMMAIRRKRNKSSQEALQKMQKIRKIKTQITQKVQLYYSQQFYGLPSSYIAYKMIKDLNKLNNSYLWYSMVGVTGMHLENKIQKEQFSNICEIYRSEMSKLNEYYSRDGEISQTAQKNSLKRKTDFEFPLLRHWSLYESIMNSSYMISGLTLWDQQGVKKLHELISLIGLSLDESKQLYKYMLKTSIEKLESSIMTYAEKQKFKLYDVAFESFAKQVDYAFEMTASDYYYALSAVMERPTKKLNIEEVYEHRVQCFWQAYSLFEANQTKLLSAIQQAKKILIVLAKEAYSILERNHILNGQNFVFVNIIDDTEDRKILQHPFTLTKLAYMLMAMNKEKKKLKYNKPFIASLQNNVTQTSQMVGIINENKNNFSSKFNVVIERLNIDVRMDAFMNNVMTVPKESMVKILRELGDM